MCASYSASALLQFCSFVFVLITSTAMGQPPTGAAPWDPRNPAHAKAVLALVRADDGICDFIYGGKVVGAFAPSSAGLLMEGLERRGIRLESKQALLLLQHLQLSCAGKDVSRLSAERLITAYRSGSRGMHGFLAELDLAHSDTQIVLSRANSPRADFSIRDPDDPRKVVAYGQSKCHATADSSRSMIEESFIKFFGNSAYPAALATPFYGYVPRDQFGMLVDNGTIDRDGRYRDPEQLRSRLLELGSAAQSGAQDWGVKNRQLIVEGADRIRTLPPSEVDRLQLRPLPHTHAEYRAMQTAYETAMASRDSPLLQPSSKSASQRGLAATAIASVAALVLGSTDGPFTKAGAGQALAAAASSIEPLQDFNGHQKRAIQRMARSLPKCLRPQIARVPNVRLLGRTAGGLGIVIGVGMLAYDTYQFGSGRMSTRDFTVSMAGTVGGAGGAVAGGFAGAAIGSVVPVVGTAIGAVAGSIAGGVAGAFGSGLATTSYWSSLDEDSIDYAIELIRRQADELQFQPQ